MSVVSSDRFRRGGRRPGWALLTVLLVLAITASAALVFTNRVELLKLAVILSLWAAVVGAFVSVMYRRQSDSDAAKARDLKLVYDLQLDREITARREYELNVEAHLRRELAREMRSQATSEVTELRAELAALRRSLEIIFDTDLEHRPALGTDRPYTEWTAQPTLPRPDRVTSSRITEVAPAGGLDPADNPIIDVPEEPAPAPLPDMPPAEPVHQGMHRRPSEDSGRMSSIPWDAPMPAPGTWTSAQEPFASPINGRGPLPPAEPERRGRHVGEPEPHDAGYTTPAPRHRGPDDEGAPTAGHSVAELLARLQQDSGGQGGRRRRRED